MPAKVGGKGSRKIGRNSGRCSAYKSNNNRMDNKERKLKKHLATKKRGKKVYANDKTAIKALKEIKTYVE